MILGRIRNIIRKRGLKAALKNAKYKELNHKHAELEASIRKMKHAIDKKAERKSTFEKMKKAYNL